MPSRNCSDSDYPMLWHISGSWYFRSETMALIAAVRSMRTCSCSGNGSLLRLPPSRLRDRLFAKLRMPNCQVILVRERSCARVRDSHQNRARDWLGRLEDPHCPAGIVKKLRYDLFLMQGSNPHCSKDFAAF